MNVVFLSGFGLDQKLVYNANCPLNRKCNHSLDSAENFKFQALNGLTYLHASLYPLIIEVG